MEVRRRVPTWFCVVAVTLFAAPACESADEGRRRHDARDGLVWHVQPPDRALQDSRGADRPFNPASVVKLATSLWALERLGPKYRFETRFGRSGPGDPSSGVVDGDLIVVGGGDPDFHVENAYLVARALNDAGVREVTGRLLVDDRFWIGWEGGAARRERDAARRATLMAVRLRDALDPERWDNATRRSIEEFVQRRGAGGPAHPRVVVRGGIARRQGTEPDRLLVIHRSNPLRMILKRFNAYSNNDIERFGEKLGTPRELAAFLAGRPAWAGPEPYFETLSGLGTNRMTPRQVVELIADLVRVCDRHEIGLDQVLPVAGCDPGTLEHFPQLEKELAGALAAKTGTLTATDGGVAVLAGIVHAAGGDRAFCIAAPRVGAAIERARRNQERWILERVAAAGGPAARPCASEVPFSDEGVEVSRPD